MKLSSFRARIALASAILAGGVLVGFGGASWWLIYNAKVSRLDEVLKNQLIRTGRLQWQDPWQVYETRLLRMIGLGAGTPVALRVVATDGELRYQSSSWPQDLTLKDWPPLPQLSPSTSGVQDRPLPPVGEPQPSTRGRSPTHRFPRGLPLPPKPQFVTRGTAQATWRVGTVTFPQSRVALAVSLESVHREMETIRNAFLVLIAVALLLIAAGAWWLSGTALSPIQRLTIAIRQVSAQGLDQRVPVGTIDVEFVELIQVFNQMLENLERSFKQASRFSADAAHELKTPLAILQGELERTLQQVEAGSEVQQRLSSLLDEVRRLSGIVRKLLLLSLADAGQMSFHRVAVNVSEILAQMEEDIELLAPQLSVQTDITASLWILGDRDLLVQVLQNLISNAIKYNLPRGWIKIQAQQRQAQVWITIANSSKTIPLRDQERIFERFHRGDPARTRRVEGTGLGLSLSREIARAHGGDLTLDVAPTAQTAFTLTLPARS